MTPPRRARRRIAGLVIPNEEILSVCCVCAAMHAGRPYLECCHEESFGGVWHHLFRVPKEHITTSRLEKMRIHTLPPLPRPDMSSMRCKSVVDLLGFTSCLSTSDGGVDDGGKRE